MSSRQRGAATALILGMVDRAIQAQREGGTAVQVTADLDEATARALGLLGAGTVSLRLEPCKPPAALLREAQR